LRLRRDEYLSICSDWLRPAPLRYERAAGIICRIKKLTFTQTSTFAIPT
jgi:hypothetical protein